jgi:hypothetical protein
MDAVGRASDGPHGPPSRQASSLSRRRHALADAQIQLGHYPEAFDATQRMVDLAPNTASLARVSYAWELRGDLEQTTSNMTRALDAATTPADKVFARYYLGELAYNAGAAAALVHYQAGGLAADPTYAPPLGRKSQGRGRPGPDRRGHRRLHVPGRAGAPAQLPGGLRRAAGGPRAYRRGRGPVRPLVAAVAAPGGSGAAGRTSACGGDHRQRGHEQQQGASNHGHGTSGTGVGQRFVAAIADGCSQPASGPERVEVAGQETREPGQTATHSCWRLPIVLLTT